MPRAWRIRFAGAKYHVTVRGNAREVIYHAPEDYERFLKQLQSALESDGVVLYAYVLMPNHAHWVARATGRSANSGCVCGGSWPTTVPWRAASRASGIS